MIIYLDIGYWKFDTCPERSRMDSLFNAWSPDNLMARPSFFCIGSEVLSLPSAFCLLSPVFCILLWYVMYYTKLRPWCQMKFSLFRELLDVISTEVERSGHERKVIYVRSQMLRPCSAWQPKKWAGSTCAIQYRGRPVCLPGAIPWGRLTAPHGVAPASRQSWLSRQEELFAEILCPGLAQWV